MAFHRAATPITHSNQSELLRFNYSTNRFWRMAAVDADGNDLPGSAYPGPADARAAADQMEWLAAKPAAAPAGSLFVFGHFLAGVAGLGSPTSKLGPKPEVPGERILDFFHPAKQFWKFWDQRV